jgi:PBP1b-binding outer membrane lipoprotein LpoB
MKKIGVIVLGLILSGCASEKPTSETIADNAINATTGLEQTLTEECKTDAIKTQLAVIKSEIRNITKSCNIEKDQITREKNSWQLGFWGLIIIIGAYIVRKVLK